MAAATTSDGALTTADGIPLKASLARAERRNRNRALLLVTPLFAFILVFFLMPIFDMLTRSVDNTVVGSVLVRSVPVLSQWDDSSGELPSEAVFKAMVLDIQDGRETRTIGKVGTRMNYEKSGMTSLFRKSGRRAKQIKEAPYKEALIKLDKKWGDINTWRLLKRESDAQTLTHYLASIDMRFNDSGEVVRQPEEKQIYINLFIRTLKLSALITVLCLVLGYPISYLLATLPVRTSNLLMILVLLPFWTSLLVRTTAWIALLQKQGVINDFLVGVGLIGDDGRLAMIHNAIGTVVAMVHILLPFMVLPLYSVMKTIPPSYVRAARSMGATPWTAFWRVYVPNTVSGIGAGGILVFIIAIGYYITPALVGGVSGTLISNFIAQHISVTLNWGLAAALGSVLLALVLALYILYDKIVGIDNMKMG
ncbi:MAG: ABC transporter permease [Gammaproteobacteria bacterium]|nr:ABC transporter permease [Gammaproteobacteria bacterium]